MDDIANQEPSAELEPGQTDFNDLGYSYDAVEIVVALYKSGLSVNEICNNKRLSHILGPYNLKRGKKFSSLKEAVKNIVHRHVNSALPKMRLINPGQARINLRYLDTGLIIGRFQPFHNGHIDMIRSVYCLGVKKIVILIGADVLMNKSKNPFAPEMMKKCMEEYFLDSPDAPFYEDAKFVFLVINDINRPDEYAEYISSKTGLNAQNAFIASNNSYTLGCFKDWACFTMGSEKAFNVSATRIRRALLNNDPSWKNDVPDQTVKFIEKNL
jgi:cytidyltransferase-like protein